MGTITQLEALITGLNVKAKAERRRGRTGTRGRKYADLHAAINTTVDMWQIAHVDFEPNIEPDVMVGVE